MAAKPSVILAALFVSGCSVAPTGRMVPATPGLPLPTGSQLSPTGYLTIHEVPSSPYPDEPPPEPQIIDDFPRRSSSPDPAIRAKAWEEKNGSPAFQAELRRLGEILPREEPDNYVQMRLVRDSGVAAEIWFRRDAAKTLARHTSNPLFRPREGGLTLEERERLQSLWQERAGRGDVIDLVGLDPLTGVVELGIAVEEAEFRRIAAERGWELGPQLKLIFPRPRPPAFSNPSLRRYVRAFARETKAKNIQLLAGYGGRIVLGDGCFRLSNSKSGEPGPLVMFGRETQLAMDRQGYLVVESRDGGRYRIGEIGSWGGPNAVDQADPEVRELRRQCGGGRITNVAEPQSERLSSIPYAEWLADYARAKSLSYRLAWNEVIACMKREEQSGRNGLEARERCIRQFN